MAATRTFLVFLYVLQKRNAAAWLVPYVRGGWAGDKNVIFYQNSH